MNEAATVGIIIVVIFTIMGLAAVIWALQSQTPPKSRKKWVRRHGGDAETGQGSGSRNNTAVGGARPHVPGHPSLQLPSNASTGLMSDIRRNIERSGA